MRVKKYKFWTIKEVNFLRENYPSKGSRFVCEALGRSMSAVRAKAADEGITCKVEYGKHNRKSRASFTKEESDYLTKLRIKAYRERRTWCHRVQGMRWYMVHSPSGYNGPPVNYAQWLWKQVYGPAPKGHVLRFKDGNCFNVTISNLYLEKQGFHVNKIISELTKEQRRVRNAYKKVKREINMHNRLGIPIPAGLASQEKYLRSIHPIIAPKEAFLKELKKDLMI